jgi:hypothetical protein
MRRLSPHLAADPSNAGRLKVLTAKEAMNIGMDIATRHTKAVLAIWDAKPEATEVEALNGTEVWLGAEIMKALMAAQSEVNQ